MNEAVTTSMDRLDGLARQCRTRFAGSRNLVWRIWGEGDPLMLLHGGYGSWRHWVRNIEVLSAGRTLYVPDLPGLGDSDDTPPEAGPDAVAGYVLEGLRELGADAETLDVVGFSFGSIIAGHLATQMAIQRLVLVGASGLGTARQPVILERTTPDGAAGDAEAALRRNLEKLMFADPRNIDDLAVAIQGINVGMARFKSRRFAGTNTLAEALGRTQAGKITAIWGEHDAVAVGAFDERLALLRELSAFRRAEIIPAAGHWVAYEAATEFDATLLAQLAI